MKNYHTGVRMIKLSLPVYYTYHYKTKPSKTFLVNMNWYRNAHHHEQNEVKHHYNTLVRNAIYGTSIRMSRYKVSYIYHFKSKVSDLSNICSMMSKFLNDSLQELGIVQNDNVQFLLEEHSYVGDYDKHFPRCDILIERIDT